MVAMRNMGMMSALFMQSFFVLPGRLLVMAGCVLVMFSGLLVMFRSFMLGHLGFSMFLYCEPDSSESKRFRTTGVNLTNRLSNHREIDVDPIYDQAIFFKIDQELFSKFWIFSPDLSRES